MKLSKEIYLKIKQSILNTWPDWKIEIANNDLIVSKNSKKIKKGENAVIYGYRVENQIQKHGLWRNFDGTWNPVFEQLSEGLSRSLPMEDNDLYRQDDKQWFSAAPSKETLKHWFSLNDVLELSELGYRVYEFELENTKHVSDFEIIFTRDNIVSQKEINYKEIWYD